MWYYEFHQVTRSLILTIGTEYHHTNIIEKISFLCNKMKYLVQERIFDWYLPITQDEMYMDKLLIDLLQNEAFSQIFV